MSGDHLKNSLAHNVRQHVYNFWCFLCLYLLGAVYVLVELNRKWQIYLGGKRLNIEKDLPTQLDESVCIITGGSRGIGLYAAKALAAKRYFVIIASSVKPGEQLTRLEQKLASEMNGKFEIWHLDLCSMDSVLAFVERFKSRQLKLNLLINNAAVMYAPFNLTKDNFETHFAVNYLGHCLFVLHLLPILSKTAKESGRYSRIVNVSSSTHYVRNLNFDDLHGIKLFSPYHAYAQAKLAQIMFTYKLQRYLETSKDPEHSGVTVNCLHPGVAKTELYEHVWWVNWFPALASFMFRTAEEGAETVIYCALSQELEGVGGKYLEDCAIVKSSGYSYDVAAQEKLWLVTWTFLKPWMFSRAPTADVCFGV